MNIYLIFLSENIFSRFEYFINKGKDIGSLYRIYGLDKKVELQHRSIDGADSVYFRTSCINQSSLPFDDISLVKLLSISRKRH
jgi:hypothetical protein